MFGNLGPMELFIILVIVLVLFGARRVPEIGASIGKGIREFKRSVSDVERQIKEPEREDRLERDLRASDRLASGDATTRETRSEDRPEPKRLL
jgi:sec-independent protein translocase protein TatA